jgi:D-amino-acid oxidase
MHVISVSADIRKNITTGMPSGQRYDVVILGAGISGITTACMLQRVGCRTLLISEIFPLIDSWEHNSPHVPTWYAMASAYPHFLEVDANETLMRNTQEFFKALLKRSTPGLTMYTMYELFEGNEVSVPPLADLRMDFTYIDSRIHLRQNETRIPYRKKYTGSISGWSFSSIFVDMPQYMPFLYQEYLKNGGTLFRRNITNRQTLLELPGTQIINCLGFKGIRIFEDTTHARIVRGRLVCAEPSPKLPPELYRTAYNYMPGSSIYNKADGSPEYLHFFPRSDGILLGQTREVGVVDQNTGSWSGVEVVDDEIEVEGVKIPESIITINEDIVSGWVGQKVRFTPRKGMCGYRYYRAPGEGGVRLEKDSNTKTVIHNYGHGGSGVTASWGCALKVASLCLGIDSKDLFNRFFCEDPFEGSSLENRMAIF